LHQVTFERSLDNVTYSPLGSATRISGGWELAGLGPPPLGQTYYVRARGRAVSGLGNGSCGLIETVRQFHGSPAVAVTDVLGTLMGEPVMVDASRLLLNDSDPDGDTLSIVAVGNGAHGTAVLVDGSVTFTPTAGYSGIDGFTYQLSDGFQLTTGSVIMNIRGEATANIIDLTFDGNDIIISFGGIQLHTYEIQHADAPTGPWTPLEGAVTIPRRGNTGEYRHVNGAGTSGFYRTRDVTP
jgi:hypothetical protein